MSNLSPEFIVTSLCSADLPTVVQLEREADISSWGVTGYERELLNPPAILLAVRQLETQELVGFFSGRTVVDEFELLSIVVRPEFRRLGIGSILLEAGLQEMEMRGLARCWLEVRSTNLAAIKLYEKFNFRLAGRRRHYYQAPADDALLLVWEK